MTWTLKQGKSTMKTLQKAAEFADFTADVVADSAFDFFSRIVGIASVEQPRARHPLFPWTVEVWTERCRNTGAATAF